MATLGLIFAAGWWERSVALIVAADKTVETVAVQAD